MAIFFNGFRHASSHLRLWLTRCQRVFQKTDASVGIKQCIHARRTCLWFELEKKKQNLSCLHTGFYFRVARAMSHDVASERVIGDNGDNIKSISDIGHFYFFQRFQNITENCRSFPNVSEYFRNFAKVNYAGEKIDFATGEWEIFIYSCRFRLYVSENETFNETFNLLRVSHSTITLKNLLPDCNLVHWQQLMLEKGKE